MLELKNIVKKYPAGDGKTTMLNIIGGLIPSYSAAKKDPVVALRSE